MRLYLDTEFNGFGGELISLALVASNGEEFYKVYQIPKNPHPWVQENVIPHLLWSRNLDPVVARTKLDFLRDFALFAYRFKNAEIVADWPADIEHFCRLLTYDGAANGFRVPANFTFKLIDRQHDYISETPHNALSDARALKQYCDDWKI